jgi:hypothetical protein
MEKQFHVVGDDGSSFKLNKHGASTNTDEMEMV